MDYQPSPPDGLAADGTTGPIRLPANVTTVMAEDLRARLVFAADHDEAIIVDASAVESIGQAGLQLLVAARREAERLDLPFTLKDASDAIIRRLASLGLAEALGLGSATETRETAQ